MTTNPEPKPPSTQADRIDIDELFRDAPVMKSAHDLAAPEIFPDDTEFEEFLAAVRADRDRDLA